MIDKIGMVNRGVFRIRFGCKEDQDKACNMNGILYDKKPFIVKPWFSKISYDKASLIMVSVWVKLPKLDVMYWSEGALKSIAGYLVKVLKVDNSTLTKSRLMYARVLVDINISEGFLEEIFYTNEINELIAQQVHMIGFQFCAPNVPNLVIFMLIVIWVNLDNLLQLMTMVFECLR